MAKCPMCSSKKGKRVCKLVDNQKICSLSCGATRDAECIGDKVFISYIGKQLTTTMVNF